MWKIPLVSATSKEHTKEGARVEHVDPTGAGGALVHPAPDRVMTGPLNGLLAGV